MNADGDTQFYAFSPEQYIERNGPMFLKYDFYEKEIKRKTQVYGRVAQVFTSYEFELTTPERTRKQRGINCIQLAKEKERWWITNIIWHSESDADPLPEDMSGGWSNRILEIITLIFSFSKSIGLLLLFLRSP